MKTGRWWKIDVCEDNDRSLGRKSAQEALEFCEELWGVTLTNGIQGCHKGKV
jgi:hypothetical protein